MPKGIPIRTAKERYEAMLPHLILGENGCVLWTGHKFRDGYGQISFEGKTHHVHRWLYQYYNGVTLTRDQHVLHSCRNRNCCSMEHLRLGTAKENMHDRIKDGTSAKKLTEEDVRYIKIALDSGQTQRSLAKKYNVDQSTICMINTGKRWGWLDASDSGS